MLAIYNPTKNLFISQMTDGPLTFLNDQLRDASQLRLNTVTRFGRNFSVVEIPYTLKLLIQELQTINVQMRIITEDNIHQFESLSYARIDDPVGLAKQLDKVVAAAAKGGQDLHAKVQEAIRSVEPATGPAASPEYHPFDSPATVLPLGSPKLPETPDLPPPTATPAETKGREEEEDPWGLLEEKTLVPGEVSRIPTSSETRPLPPTELSPSVHRVYEKRQFVHLAGDTKPDRLWYIHDMVTTKNHTVIYTLMTNDYEGLRPQDQIQVVKEARLIPMDTMGTAAATTKEGDAGPAQKITGGGMGGPFRMRGMGAPNGMDAEDANFIFAPVLVNGNNNMFPDPGSSGGMAGGAPIPFIPGGQGGGGVGGNPALPPLALQNMGLQNIGLQNIGPMPSLTSSSAATAKKEESSSAGGEPKKGASWFSKAIDFGSSILVKKTG